MIFFANNPQSKICIYLAYKMVVMLYLTELSCCCMALCLWVWIAEGWFYFLSCQGDLLLCIIHQDRTIWLRFQRMIWTGLALLLSHSRRYCCLYLLKSGCSNCCSKPIKFFQITNRSSFFWFVEFSTLSMLSSTSFRIAETLSATFDMPNSCSRVVVISRICVGYQDLDVLASIARWGRFPW